MTSSVDLSPVPQTRRVGPTQDAVLGLIAELGLETFPSYDDGEALTVFDGKVVRYADETFGLPPQTAMEVGRLWEQIETLAATVDAATPWQTPGAGELDRQTVDPWIAASSSDTIARRSSACSSRRCSPPKPRRSRCCTSCSTSSQATA
jgi:monoamine oxidase